MQIGSLTTLWYDHIAFIEDTTCPGRKKAFWLTSMHWTMNLSLQADISRKKVHAHNSLVFANSGPEKIKVFTVTFSSYPKLHSYSEQGNLLRSKLIQSYFWIKLLIINFLNFVFDFVTLTECKATASFVSQIAWFQLLYLPFGCDHGNSLFFIFAANFIFQLFD